MSGDLNKQKGVWDTKNVRRNIWNMAWRGHDRRAGQAFWMSAAKGDPRALSQVLTRALPHAVTTSP